MENWIAFPYTYAKNISTSDNSFLGLHFHQQVFQHLLVRFLEENSQFIEFDKTVFAREFHMPQNRVERLFMHPWMSRKIRYQLKTVGPGRKHVLILGLLQPISEYTCWEKEYTSHAEQWIAVPSWLFLDPCTLFFVLEYAEKRKIRYSTQEISRVEKTVYEVTQLLEKRKHIFSYQKIQIRKGASTLWEIHFPKPIEEYIRFLP